MKLYYNNKLICILVVWFQYELYIICVVNSLPLPFHPQTICNYLIEYFVTTYIITYCLWMEGEGELTTQILCNY